MHLVCSRVGGQVGAKMRKFARVSRDMLAYLFVQCKSQIGEQEKQLEIGGR